MVGMARAQTACRATARVARTRTRARGEQDPLLVRATLAVALRASWRTIFFPSTLLLLTPMGRGKAGPWPQWEMIMRCYPRDHKCTVLSLAEAINRPSGDQATARTHALWAVYVAIRSPVATDQTCTVVSSPQEA